MQITPLTAQQLLPQCDAVFAAAAPKVDSIDTDWDASQGAPVFTIEGRYTTRGWTEWTQGFQFGCAILLYDATDQTRFLEVGRNRTVRYMASHVSHIGVHDHGFNNVSTYGNLLRLAREGRLAASEWEIAFYELALKLSGAVQAARWTTIADGSGFIHSFNGPHSLFVDTIRTVRALCVGHQLGHALMGENDRRHNLLERAVQHAINTARYNVYYGEGRDSYDLRGRTVHEAIFNCNDGNFRCPSTQQGYSPFSTWTRGLSWAVTGFAEQLEYLQTLDASQFEALGGRDRIVAIYEKAALATADFYIQHTPRNGVPYWDTGAPGLAHLGDYLAHDADPYNEHEPVDSSAAAITAQGLVRLGNYLRATGRADEGTRYQQAGLTVAASLFDEPYLSTDPDHQGLLLHSVYHRPNGWDHAPRPDGVPSGEATMWGDYHALELANLIRRMAREETYPTFFG